MIDAAVSAFADLFAAPLRRVLLKSIGFALLLIVLIGIGLHHLFANLAESGANWAEQTSGFAPHAAWTTLAFIVSVIASLGIITGAVFLMPTVTAFVGSFFVDEVADIVERKHYPAEAPGRALPLLRALIEGLKFAALAFAVYLCALPFVLFAGLGVIVLLLANAYLLGREYFELAAMRFRPPDEAKKLRRAHATAVFMAGLVIAVFVSVPLLNLATPIFAMALMVHMHKRLSQPRAPVTASYRR